MSIDYTYYSKTYQGHKLTQDVFPKYIDKSLNIISRYTMNRVTANNIDSYPALLSRRIKNCACELCEFIFDVDRLQDLGVSSSLNEGTINQKPIKSVTAGAVSYTLDSNLSNSVSKNYIDRKAIDQRYKSILNEYLYPQWLDNEYYNLLSWVSRSC